VNRANAVEGFHQVFHRHPTFVTRAPGRVNLIGEHTDYNDGFVMPAAIGFATWTAISPRPDRTLHVHAGNRKEFVAIDLDAPGDPLQRHWSDYVRGVAVELERDGHRLSGADLWFAGDVPAGAGLSSSAALEMSVGFALLLQSSIPIDRTRLALAGQRAEHHFAGTKCGIMDQFISAHGQAQHALLLDCRTLGFRALLIPESLRLVICDTGVQHALAGGEYNTRRAQCEEGVAYLRNFVPSIRALRDVSPAQLDAFAGGLSHVVQQRCRHVVSENQRVEEFAQALETSDVDRLGDLMAASHASLRDDYEVSCPELDALVEFANEAPGIVGARMTGGGFGGCTVNLVHAADVDAFQTHVAEAYERRTGRVQRIFVTEAADGASEVPGAVNP
jgi:galactokinase